MVPDPRGSLLVRVHRLVLLLLEWPSAFGLNAVSFWSLPLGLFEYLCCPRFAGHRLPSRVFQVASGMVSSGPLLAHFGLCCFALADCLLRYVAKPVKPYSPEAQRCESSRQEEGLKVKPAREMA